MTHRWLVIIVAVCVAGLISSESVAQRGRGGGGERCSGGGGGRTMPDRMFSGGEVRGQDAGYYNPLMQQAYRNYWQQRAVAETENAEQKKEERERRLKSCRARRLEELAKRERRRQRIAQENGGTRRTSDSVYTAR